MKWIMLTTAVAFVGLMVFGWGMDITGRSNAAAAGGEIGRVNGEPIFYQEWLTIYRNLFEQQQRQQPGQPVGAAMVRQLEEAAWEQMVTQRLMNQELKRRGIEVTESEIRQAARFAPPPEFMNNDLFKTDGQFDQQKYVAYLSSQSVDPQLLLQLEAYYRDVIPRSKLFYQVTAGTYLPDGELWRIFSDGRATAKVRYIAIDPDLVVADANVTVTAKEIEQYYNKNKSEFKRAATAQVKYVTMDRSPIAADSAESLARAQQVREAASSDFAGVAQRESADSVSGRAGGALGKVRRGQMIPAFEQAAFSLPVGKISEPLLTQFGYHIVKVESRTAEEAEVRHILIPIARSPENEERLLDRADSLETLGEGMPLARVAERMGLRVREAEINDSTPFLPAVGPADDAAQWVFREGEAGEVSEAFETPSLYYMVEITSKTEAGVISLSAATPEIRRKLTLEKKLARAQETARAVVDRIRSGATLDDAAKQAGFTVAEAGPFTRLEFVPGLGRANAAIGTAFGQKPGQISGAVDAEGMLFIVQTVETTEASREDFEAQKQASRGRLTQVLAEQRWTQFMAALKETAKIVDNRADLQRQQTEVNTNPLGF